jgi:hypothetical protein
MKFLFSLLLGFLLSFSVFAEEPSAQVFKMYKTPGHTLNTYCDVHTRLVINYYAKTATLSEGADGPCRLQVKPNSRTYGLGPSVRTSASTTIHGSGLKFDGTITIVDTRGTPSRVLGGSYLSVYENTEGLNHILYGYEVTGK